MAPPPYLKLVESARQRTIEVRDAVARLGRDPASTMVFDSGDDAKVVSNRHAEVRWGNGVWRLADTGSRNGTFLNGQRLATETDLKVGDVIRLGETGPSLTVAATTGAAEPTLAEHPQFNPHSGAPPRPAESRAYGVTLLATGSGRRFEARGIRIRLGRGSECEIQPVEPTDKSVSRVHAEMTVGVSGGLVVRDVGSKNGTFVNGSRITTPVPVRLGDKIMLGEGGPVLYVEGLGTAPMPAVARPKPGGLGQQTVMGMIGQALQKAKEERKKGHRGSTAFFKAVAEEVGKDSRRKIRWLAAAIVLLMLLLGGAVALVLKVWQSQSRQTAQAFQSIEDSARAETERLRRELAEARAAAAPASQVELLRAQLESAQVNTAALRAAMNRAQEALTQQLAAGETSRVRAQNDLQRLREELAGAQQRAPSPAMIDSLRRAVAAAESQTASLDAKMRAIRGTDFASIAQQNQGAVGLITVSLGGEVFDGTGFVISADGYMLTNWHVVADSSHTQPDTMWVTMADQSVARFADVVATSRERDIALIRIRQYQGAVLTGLDWGGSKARQGEPAALIGYPAGSGFARDRTSAVRTSMTAGILSRVTPELVQFDGMTIGGSSGSPVFNANGEVISIHRAGLRQGPGFALSVPVKFAIPLMPGGLKQRLGIQ